MKARELRSQVDDGTLRLMLEEVELSPPTGDEVIVRVEAAPINPSDLALLLGPADLATLEREGDGLRLAIPASRMATVRARVGRSLAVGNEGAGTVVAAGPDAAALDGRLVAMSGGGMYATHRKLRAKDTIVVPDGATAAQAASMFVNPLTALGFVETARAEGHAAIVHTAAASNLGQMLQKICRADGIALVNVVRSAEQEAILRDIGATHVVNSRAEDFRTRLRAAIAETGATIAFDAIGGGTIGSDIVQAMEQAAVAKLDGYDRYGSTTFKQLYIYGALDLSPTTLNRLAFGFEWSVGGWLLTPFLRKADVEVVGRMRRRVAEELTTTFASRYTRTIGLAEALDPDVLRGYEAKRTGEKYLIDPTR